MGSSHNSYQIRRAGGAPDNPAYNINVPKAMAKAVPAGTRFAPEFTEDGILYRFTGRTVTIPPESLPAWAKVESDV